MQAALGEGCPDPRSAENPIETPSSLATPVEVVEERIDIVLIGNGWERVLDRRAVENASGLPENR